MTHDSRDVLGRNAGLGGRDAEAHPATVAVTEGCAAQMPMLETGKLVSGKAKVGMTRGDIVYILGKPRRTENVGQVEFCYTRQCCTPCIWRRRIPLAIREGTVVGIGKAYYDETVQSLNVAQASK